MYMDIIEIDVNDILENMEMGIYRITYTNIPAFQRLGVSLNDSGDTKEYGIINNRRREYFNQVVQQRISGPLILVDDVYRNKDGEEYMMRFDYNTNKLLAEQLQKKLPTLGKDIFTIMHNDDHKIDSYILNILFIEGEDERKFIKNKYDYDIQVGDVWIDTKIPNLDDFNYLVDNNYIGFSMETMLAYNIKKNKEEFNKNKNKSKMIKRIVNDKVLVFESFNKNSEVYNLEDTSEKLNMIYQEKNKTYIIANNLIKSVFEKIEVEEEELEDEIKEEVKVEEELEDEVKVEEELEDEVKVEDLEEVEEVKVEELEESKIEELITIISEIREDLNNLRNELNLKDEDLEEIIEVKEDDKFNSNLRKLIFGNK